MINGVVRQVADYRNWRQDLLRVLGNCCCYCNMPLSDSPQVEHVSPKNPRAGQAAGAYLDWDNMLLACGVCNRAKGNQPTGINLQYLAETHNTHLALEYFVVRHPTKPGVFACIPKASIMAGVDNAKAIATIDLCDLDNVSWDDPRAIDMRWQYRFQAFEDAKLWRVNWDAWGHHRQDAFIPLLLTAATGKGFFSIWMQVFSDVPAVCLALINEFPGTAQDCFDQNGVPIPRNGQAI